ncbi:MAG: glycosyltransferase [Alphaproteobacteria bacterium]|nr:glycosyltransferase [Alphaproteobacteria bacterium]
MELVLLWGARVGLALIGLFWLLTALGVARKRKEAAWRLGPDSPVPDAAPSLSIVVPARDEVANIERCVRGAVAQDLPQVQVVVLDDGSTDGTSEVLARLSAEFPERLTVLTGGDAPLPSGWLGKPWACQRAARAATGDWILFIDADVELFPRAAGAAMAAAITHDAGLVSGLGHLEVHSFWEKVMQPVVAGLIMSGNDLDVLNDPEKRPERPLANGQFLLFRRDCYEALGGHEAVRQAVVDDVGMAVATLGGGFEYRLFMMRELFTCRMYDSLGALWEGWTKNLFTGIRRSWGVLIGLELFLFAHNVLPVLLLLAGLVGLVGPEFLAWGGALTFILVVVRIYLDRAYGLDWRYAVTQPLGVAMLQVLLVHSAVRTIRGTASWKGRQLDLDPGEGAKRD